MRNSTGLAAALAAAGLLAAASVSLRAQDAVASARRPASGRAAEIEVLQLRPNFYLIAGAGGNVGVQVGDDGVVVVDTGSAPAADAFLAAIRRITPKPIRYIIDTNADADHVGGNEAIARAGQTLFTGGGGAGVPADFLGGGASILAAEKVL